MPYFNYTVTAADPASFWERRAFLHKWWRLYSGDKRWTPPPYRRFLAHLTPQHNEHLARCQPLLRYVEALPRRAASGSAAYGWQQTEPAGLFEVPLAAAVLLTDPRRRDGTSYLSLFHAANDYGAIEALLYHSLEQLVPEGSRRLLLSTALSPHLGAGLLYDHWDARPPLHTPYNPPYLPELVEKKLRPWRRTRLYHYELQGEPEPRQAGPIILSPLNPARLAGDLLSLWPAVTADEAGFPPPDVAEATYLLNRLATGASGWLATVDDQAVGFVLLEPDLAPRLRQAGGGRSLHWRTWYAWRRNAPTTSGRLLFGGVLPQWRRQGIGRLLWQQVLRTAQDAGWTGVAVGPVPEKSAGAGFLAHVGAQPRQTYVLYEWTF